MVAQIFIVCFGSIFEQTRVAYDGIRVKEALLRTIFFVHYIWCRMYKLQPASDLMSALYCTSQNTGVLYCTVLHCTVLYAAVQIVVVPFLRSLNRRKKYILGVRQERKAK